MRLQLNEFCKRNDVKVVVKCVIFVLFKSYEYVFVCFYISVLDEKWIMMQSARQKKEKYMRLNPILFNIQINKEKKMSFDWK